MSSEEERKELPKEPLPKGPEDESIPTRIFRYQETIRAEQDCIAKHEHNISLAQLEITALLKRAKELAITQDNSYKIVEIPVYKKNRVLVDVLKLLAANDYNTIRANIAAGISDKMTKEILKMDSFISQENVKAVIKDKALLAQIIPPNTEIESYQLSIVPR